MRVLGMIPHAHVAVTCDAPWGSYTYRGKRLTMRTLREAIDAASDGLDDDILDECRRYGSSPDAQIENDGNPNVALFRALVRNNAAELARDERIRESCREAGWDGKADLGSAASNIGRRVTVHMRVRRREHLRRMPTGKSCNVPFDSLGVAVMARDEFVPAEHWANDIHFDPKLILRTIAAHLRGTGSTITAEEHLCRKVMGRLWSALGVDS